MNKQTSEEKKITEKLRDRDGTPPDDPLYRAMRNDGLIVTREDKFANRKALGWTTYLNRRRKEIKAGKERE